MRIDRTSGRAASQQEAPQVGQAGSAHPRIGLAAVGGAVLLAGALLVPSFMGGGSAEAAVLEAAQAFSDRMDLALADDTISSDELAELQGLGQLLLDSIEAHPDELGELSPSDLASVNETLLAFEALGAGDVGDAAAGHVDDAAAADVDDAAAADVDDAAAGDVDDAAAADVDDAAAADVDDAAVEDVDDGAVEDVDDGAVGDVDDGAVGDVDDGAVGDTDDGAVGDVDDGAVGDVDDGAVGDTDDGAAGDNDDDDAGDGDDDASVPE